MKRILLVLAALVLAVMPAGAQKKWNFQLGLAGSLNQGNVENVGFSNNGSVERNDSILAFDGHYKLLYSETDRVANNREFGAGIKFDVLQYGKFSPFFAGEYLTNHFKGYDSKVSLLVGAKYRIISKPGVYDYSFSAAYVSDFVDYYVATELENQVSRLSLRIKIKQKISDVVSINHTTFYQPSLAGGDAFTNDYIVTSSTRIQNKIGKYFSLDLIFDYEHRNLVPEGTKRDDTHAQIGLTVKF